MDIQLKKVSIADLTNGFQDNNDNGVVGYGGKLNIRPAYQREFIYKEKQRDAVITTILQGFPLNVMYWADNGDGTYEIIDGQQRTMSICQYVAGVFSYKFQNIGTNYFQNIPADIRQRILDYELLVYVCKGNESEKLDWFRTINIAGEQLTDQELLNATYTGPWLSDAKKYFSKRNCPAAQIASNYVNGSAERQELLATALKWISNGHIEAYMAEHQRDNNALALWTYFRNVIEWVQNTFPIYHKEMKGIAWASLYETYHNQVLEIDAIKQEIEELMQDGEIQDRKGIYKYVLDHNEQHLDLRTFDEKTRQKVYAKQSGICPICGECFDIKEMEADHIIPWNRGGRTTIDNCQMLCMKCNRTKSGK